MQSEIIERQILNAAINIFQVKGMHGARMHEIANEANMNKALLYYYFKNKKLLFEASFMEIFTLFAEQFNTILNNHSTITNKITQFTRAYTVFASNHPYLAIFIIQELNQNPEFIKKINEKIPSIEKFKLQVEQEIEQGILIPIMSDQLFINVISLILFPTISNPLLKYCINYNEKEYKNLLKTRKTEITNFIINSIKQK